MNSVNLNTERVEDHFSNAGHIEMEDSEMKVLEPGYYLQELLRSPLGEHFEIGMAFDHRHFDVSDRRMVLGHCFIC